MSQHIPQLFEEHIVSLRVGHDTSYKEEYLTNSNHTLSSFTSAYTQTRVSTISVCKGLVYFLLEELFPLPFPDGFPVLLGAFRGLPLLFPLLLFSLPPFFAMLMD